MIGMKIGWLLLEGTLVCLFLYTGSTVALSFAALLILIPLLFLPVNLLIRKRIVAEVVSCGNLRKGDTGNITVSLENPTAIPLLRVRCCICVENQLNGDVRQVWITTHAMPKKEQKVTLKIENDYCGRNRISVSKIRLYDCFGLIPVSCKTEAATHLTVQPDTFETSIQIVPNPSSTDDSELYAQDRPGSDLTETYQIREYVPGDSMRQIHWKLTGKFDRMIVRDPSLPITRSVLVFWERTGESGDAALIDAQAEVVVSICQALLDQSVQFTIGWNDTERQVCVLQEIHDLDELVGVLPRLLRAYGAKEGVSGASLLLQTGGEALCGHMIYVAEQPQSEIMELQRFGRVIPVLCGETAVEGALMFDALHYEEQLMQIEI